MTTTLLPIILWTQPGCGPCITAPAALKARKIPHIIMNARNADSARVANWRKAGLTTPILEVEGNYYPGMDVDTLDALAQERGVLA